MCHPLKANPEARDPVVSDRKDLHTRSGSVRNVYVLDFTYQTVNAHRVLPNSDRSLATGTSRANHFLHAVKRSRIVSWTGPLLATTKQSSL